VFIGLKPLFSSFCISIADNLECDRFHVTHFGEYNLPKKYYMLIHHGQIVEKVIRRNGHSISEIARVTGVNRRSVYNWFNQRILKEDIVVRLGRAIHHDFSSMIPDLKLTTTDFNPTVQTVNSQPDEESIWKDRYIELLERYNALLETIPLSIELV
jgi:predicted transcriptional regulator